MGLATPTGVSIVLLISAFMIFALVLPTVVAQPPQGGQQQPPQGQQQPPSGPPENECPICHQQFSSGLEVLAHHYLTHFQEHNPPGEAVYCLICGEKFSTPEEVASHILAAHAGEPPSAETYCPFCGAKVTTTEMPAEQAQYEMYVHWATVHDWWPEAWEPPENWWPGGMRPPSDWTPPETWEVPENLRKDVIPPYMPEGSWRRPENWTPREDWVPSERWKPSSTQPIPELMPENLEAIDLKKKEYHWVPPENKPFWVCHADNVTADAPVGFYIPENSTPFVRSADNWIPAEGMVENVFVGGVKMSVKENVSDVVVTALPLEPEDLPEDVPPPEENCCELFQVGTNVPDLIENAEIGVKVDQDWIAANNLEDNSITLKHCVNGVWEDLPTKIKGEDENYLYLSAETPSFSVFAVTGKTAAVAGVPSAGAPVTTLAAVVIVVLAVITIAVWRIRKK
jgi:PGF-pre-PGF domain-containing protein